MPDYRASVSISQGQTTLKGCTPWPLHKTRKITKGKYNYNDHFKYFIQYEIYHNIPQTKNLYILSVNQLMDMQFVPLFGYYE